MYSIYHLEEYNLPHLVLENKDGTTSAKISLQEGGRVKELKCNDTFIIKEIAEFNYKTSYASSVLFPFASRIQDGKFNFYGEDFQLEKNDNNVNALHGLIFNKTFEVFEPETHADNCSVTLNYYENTRSTGFPFKYFISLTYTLTKEGLQLKVTVKNIDTSSFPYILGWHPYFFSDDLSKSELKFNSDKKVVFDENLITKEVVDYKEDMPFQVGSNQLDDCFILKDNEVRFSTSTYQVTIASNVDENFLQLYTPKDLPLIAIEPMTGISNSFNNKIGLQVLQPNETCSIKWDVTITTK